MADPLANLLAESGGLTFNQAFANARARGETTFRWRDPKTNRVQTYTTARADDRPARPSNNAMLESTRARREATDLMSLPMMPADLPAKNSPLAPCLRHSATWYSTPLSSRLPFHEGALALSELLVKTLMSPSFFWYVLIIWFGFRLF